MSPKGGETWGTPAPDSITLPRAYCHHQDFRIVNPQSALDQFLHTGTNENCPWGQTEYTPI
jgi:hypothetical protein